MSEHDTDPDGIELPTKRVDAETLKEKLTDNAYDSIIPARYLRTDRQGELIEEPEDLFPRVAKNVAVAEAVYTEEHVTVTPTEIKPDHPNRDGLLSEVFSAYEETIGDVSEDSHVKANLTEDVAKWVAYEPLVERCEEQGWTKTLGALEQRAEEFEIAMEHLRFVPNSPTLMNAGDQFQQLSACFVNSPDDDIGDIYQTVKEGAQVMQSGGGMGYSFSYLRPYGDVVGSSGGIASGPITFMRSFDQMCSTIAQGGTRRGAQMGVMRCTHPDLPFFIHAKNKDVSLAQTLKLNDPDDFTHTSFTGALKEAREILDDFGGVPEHLRNAVEGHLSNFNISVCVTDGFMDAALAGEEIKMINPRTGAAHIATEHTEELYEMFDLGEHVEVGEPLSVPAEVLLDRMVEGAHENGEPGVLFVDRANEDHSFPAESTPDAASNSEYEMHTTNPCGEQWLMEYEACNLGHINLSTIVASDAPDWRTSHDPRDYEDDEAAVEAFLDDAIWWNELDRRIELGVRFLDNVVTMSNFTFEDSDGRRFDDIEETVQSFRKIGLGIMGLAELYVQLGVRYGGDIANEIGRQLMRHINQHSKRVSHRLAEERGAFDAWRDSKYGAPEEYPTWFERQTGEPYNDWIGGFPIRNHNTTTVAPTGTTSMLGNTTGGCEPIYNVAFYKNVSDDVQGDEMLVEFNDLFLRALEENDIDVDAVRSEAERQMAANEFDGVSSLRRVPDELGDLFVTTGELSGVEHASIQCALQEGVDSAISKTVNCSNDVDQDYVREVVEYLYTHGAKGATIYRDGSRSKQVKTTRADNRLDDAGEDLSEDEARDLIREVAEENDIPIRVDDGLPELQDDGPDPEDFEVEHRPERIALADIDDETTPVEEATDNGFVSKRDRPDVLYGSTQRITTGYGKLYVNVNEDEGGRPFEVFANTGNSGGYTNGFVEAIAKLASLSLRAGVDPEEVADELEGINSPKPGWDRGEQISSIPDAVGVGLRRHLEGELPGAPQTAEPSETASTTAEEGGPPGANPGGSTAETLVQNGESPQCPECGEMEVHYSEGCKACELCGWSEC